MGKKIFGQIGRLKSGKIDEYKSLHAQPWPEVLDMIRACNIANYSIFLHEDLVFACFEYVGVDYVTDMEKMARDEKTQEWWLHTKPCFEKHAMGAQAEFYCDMQQIFYCE